MNPERPRHLAKAVITQENLQNLGDFLPQFPSDALQKAERIDFAREATISTYLTQNSEGNFLCADGSSAEEYCSDFSLMKFGKVEAVQRVANRLARAAVTDQNFLDFVKSSHGYVYICSPGIYNIKSASNLLLHETSKILNIFLSKNNLPTLIVKDLTKHSESAFNYAEQSIAARKSEAHVASIIPSEFAGQSVIFLDDILISGNGLELHKKAFQAAEVSKLHFLLAAHMDPAIVEKTDGKIEDELNRVVVDSQSREGLLELFSGEVVIVRKTLRLLLHPRNRDILTNTIPEMLVEDKLLRLFLEIYSIAAGNDYWNRYDKQFVPALEFIEDFLRERNLLDERGLPYV